MYGIDLTFFFEDDCFPQRVSSRLVGNAEPEGCPAKLIRFFSTLRARRAGHGAGTRARLATGGSPVDSPSAEASGTEICRARPSRKRPAGRKKNDFTLLYKAPLRGVGCFPRGDASWHATGERYQSPSSGTGSMRVIPKESNI